MAQRSIETLIGRPIAELEGFIESGYELTPLEISAVRATHGHLWTRIAEQIDPRLQKASLNPFDQE